MGITRIKTWQDREVLTHSDLNNEFDNIAGSVELNADVTDADNVAAATAVMDADFTAANEVMVGSAAGTHSQVTLATSQILGRKSTGSVTNLTAGDIMTLLSGQATADFSMNTHKITSVVDPTTDQEVATKKYVDDNIGGSGGLISVGDTSVECIDTGDGEIIFTEDGVESGKISGGYLDMNIPAILTGIIPLCQRRDINTLWSQISDTYQLKNSVDDWHTYSQISAVIRDNTDGAEDGGLLFYTSRGGASEEGMRITEDTIIINEAGTDRDFKIKSDTITNAFFLRGSDGQSAFGTSSPNEQVTIEGALSLDEITVPSVTAGYGKIYVKSSDSLLYFKDSSDVEFLLAGNSVPSGARGDMLYRNDSGWQAYAGPYNAKGWGATAGDTGDDGPEINAAIVAANTNGVGEVYLPGGTYRISTTILLKSNVRLVGASDGSTIINAYNVTPAISMSAGAVVQRAGLKNIKITTTTNSADTAIYLRSIQFSTFKNIEIEKYYTGTGIHVQPDVADNYAYMNEWNNIRIGLVPNGSLHGIGTGIFLQGLWGTGIGGDNHGVTGNYYRGINIYYVKDYGIRHYSFNDHDKFFGTIIRTNVSNSVLVEFDPASDPEQVYCNEYHDLTLTADQASISGVVGLKFLDAKPHRFLGLSFGTGTWPGTEIDHSGAGAGSKMYAVGHNCDGWTQNIWTHGDLNHILGSDDYVWRQTDGGTARMTLYGSTGNLVTGGTVKAAPASGNGNLYANGATASDYGNISCTSNNIDRIKFFANDTASYFDYTGNLSFRTIAGAAKAILYSTGNLSLDGTLTENAWTLTKSDIDRKWELTDSILAAYKVHDGRMLDPSLRVKTGNKWGKRPSDFIQIAIECIAELRKRIEVLEKTAEKH